MCVRDAAPYVAQAVESVLRQTLRDLELVVVDDASSDATPSILRDLARRDPRIRVRRAETHLGLAAAQNLACASARAPLLAHLDGDDVAVPDRVERQAAYLDAHPGTALAGGAAVVIDEAGRPHHTLRPPTGDGAIRAALSRRNCIIHSTVMVRADALRRAGGYRTRFEFADDYDLWLRLADRYRLVNLPDVLVYYRVHAGQASEQDVERQAVGVLAVQALARRRRAGLDESPTGDGPITVAELRELGVGDEALVRAVTRICLVRALLMDDIERPRLALVALARTPGFATSPAVRRRTLAGYRAALARRRWRRGERARALGAALRAVRTRPALLARIPGLLRPRQQPAEP
jgi:GT2 family glycosyltransferase